MAKEAITKLLDPWTNKVNYKYIIHMHVVLKIIISRIKQVIKGLTAAVSELMSYRIYIKTDKVIYRGRFARRHENKEKKKHIFRNATEIIS